MAIKIVEDGPDITVSRSEFNRFSQDYRKAFQMYAGAVPTLEEYIRGRLQEENNNRSRLITESK